MSSTHGVQQNFLKLSVAYTKKNSDPVYEKQNQNKITTTQICLSSSGKGGPLDPEKCALIFFLISFFLFFLSSELCVHSVVCQFPDFEDKSLPHYTIVQTVFKLGSNRTAFPSTDFAFVSYMGFSKAACPLLFSCTEHPVYCVLGAVL